MHAPMMTMALQNLEVCIRDHGANRDSARMSRASITEPKLEHPFPAILLSTLSEAYTIRTSHTCRE